MAEAKRTPKSHKIADVARPGKSAPSPNSRSVIISHRPIMRDPMMSVGTSEAASSDEAANDAPATAVKVTRASGAVVQPLADSTLTAANDEAVPDTEATPNDEADAEEVETVETEAEAVTADEAPEAEAKDETPQETKHEAPPAQASTGTDAKLGTKDAQSEAEIAAAEDAEAKRQAALLEMIESKKYYLPINTVEKRRTKQFVAGGIVLSLLLIAAWLDIAMDAGLIKIGHWHALTHFFN